MLPNDRQMPPLRCMSKSKRPPAAVTDRFGVGMPENVFRFFFGYIVFQQMLHVAVWILVESGRFLFFFSEEVEVVS